MRALLRSEAILFFAWAFVIHSTGLLVHEFGGHALAGSVLACGIEGYKLTLFGHGQVFYAPCGRWTDTTILVADWAGLVVTIALGIVAAFVARRRGLAPMTRLLAAFLATGFLLQQLAYATSGGFHDLYDPGRLARRLGAHHLHVLAWLPALAAYAVSAFAGARAIVEAFRVQFGSRSRANTLIQLVSTAGVGGALYYVAFRIEWELRTDVTMRGVAAEAQRIAVARKTTPPFPIEHVLIALAVVLFILALARPVKTSGPPATTPRRIVMTVWAAAAACFVVLAVLIAVAC